MQKITLNIDELNFSEGFEQMHVYSRHAYNVLYFEQLVMIFLYLKHVENLYSCRLYFSYNVGRISLQNQNVTLVASRFVHTLVMFQCENVSNQTLFLPTQCIHHNLFCDFRDILFNQNLFSMIFLLCIIFCFFFNLKSKKNTSLAQNLFQFLSTTRLHFF